MDIDPRARALWAKTRLLVWPERYRLVSLPLDRLQDALSILARSQGSFAAVVVERDEISLTVEEGLWLASPLKAGARNEAGPFRAITLDIDLDLDVCGYLAPAAALLGEAGVSIVPQCAFLKDHVLVHDGDLERSQRVLENWTRDCASRNL